MENRVRRHDEILLVERANSGAKNRGGGASAVALLIAMLSASPKVYYARNRHEIYLCDPASDKATEMSLADFCLIPLD